MQLYILLRSAFERMASDIVAACLVVDALNTDGDHLAESDAVLHVGHHVSLNQHLKKKMIFVISGHKSHHLGAG